jgi:hypothetical protein
MRGEADQPSPRWERLAGKRVVGRSYFNKLHGRSDPLAQRPEHVSKYGGGAIYPPVNTYSEPGTPVSAVAGTSATAVDPVTSQTPSTISIGDSAALGQHLENIEAEVRQLRS